MKKIKNIVVCHRHTEKGYIIYNVTAFDFRGNKRVLLQLDERKIRNATRYLSVRNMMDFVIDLCHANGFKVESYSNDFDAKWYPIDFINVDNEYIQLDRYGYSNEVCNEIL